MDLSTPRSGVEGQHRATLTRAAAPEAPPRPPCGGLRPCAHGRLREGAQAEEHGSGASARRSDVRWREEGGRATDMAERGGAGVRERLRRESQGAGGKSSDSGARDAIVGQADRRHTSTTTRTTVESMHCSTARVMSESLQVLRHQRGATSPPSMLCYFLS